MAIKNIPLIHNFCDRWCERCTFTTRCAVFQSEKQGANEDLDIKNRAFWERLSQNFAKAKTLLEEAAKKSGVDLASIEFTPADAERKEEDLRVKSNQHPAGKLSLEYSDLTRGWLKTQPGMLDKLELLKEELTLGIESQQHAKEQIETIKESLAVIEWYSTFIHIKLIRALMGKGDELFDDDDDQADFNGSAKIAIIAIERSMQSWIRIFELLPGEEDHFLRVLALLEKIKTEVLNEFPNAMRFVRPGFDENLS
jgi:hypothetical protein